MAAARQSGAALCLPLLPVGPGRAARDAHLTLTLSHAQEVVDDPGGNKMLLVMDYMEGGPVLTREALERGRRIPEPLALQYFRDMCKAG